MTDLLEPLARMLGQFVGTSIAYFAAFVLYLILVYALWGFWWERILTKAGFTGAVHDRLLLMLIFPFLLAIVADWLPSDIGEVIMALGLLVFYVGFIAVAMMPWPKKSPGIDKPGPFR